MVLEDLSEREKLIYLAGLIDGEGTIRIHHSLQKNSFSIVLSVSNTNEDLMHWLKQTFSGKIYQHSRTNPNWKLAFEWELNGRDAYKLIQKIAEFLLIKSEQSKIALKFYYQTQRISFKGLNNRRPLWLLKRQDDYYNQMKQLNQKGPNENAKL